MHLNNKVRLKKFIHILGFPYIVFGVSEEQSWRHVMMLGTAGGAGEKGGELGAMTMLMFLVRYFNFTRSFSRNASLKNKKN